MTLQDKGVTASLLLYGISLPLSMSGTNIALGMILAFSAWFIYSDKNRFRLPTSIILLLIFFLWAAITVWIANERFDPLALKSFEKIWNFCPLLLIPTLSPLKSENFHKIFTWTFAVASGVVLLGLFQYYFDFTYFFQKWFQEEGLVYQKRFYGFQSHPLHSGGLYCLLALCALAFYIFDSRKRIVYAPAFLILSLGVALTQSRSYYIALAVGSMILLAIKGWKPLFIGLAIGGILITTVAVLDQGFRARMNTMRINHLDDSAKIRIRLWQTALAMFKDHSLTGVGYRNWDKNLLEYSRRIPEWSLDKGAHAHAHNSYLNIAAETGLPGVILILSFWFLLLKEQMKYLRTHAQTHPGYVLTLASIAGIAAILIGGLFEHNFLTATTTLGLFFITGLSRLPGTA